MSTEILGIGGVSNTSVFEDVMVWLSHYALHDENEVWCQYYSLGIKMITGTFSFM